jgi:hypothetical protein
LSGVSNQFLIELAAEGIGKSAFTRAIQNLTDETRVSAASWADLPSTAGHGVPSETLTTWSRKHQLEAPRCPEAVPETILGRLIPLARLKLFFLEHYAHDFPDGDSFDMWFSGVMPLPFEQQKNKLRKYLLGSSFIYWATFATRRETFGRPFDHPLLATRSDWLSALGLNRADLPEPHVRFEYRLDAYVSNPVERTLAGSRFSANPNALFPSCPDAYAGVSSSWNSNFRVAEIGAANGWTESWTGAPKPARPEAVHAPINGSSLVLGFSIL